MYNGHTERLTENERVILSLIGEGKANGTSLRTLSTLSHLPEREMRQLIENMRRAGIIILSGANGYFFPADDSEIEDYVRREDKRARSIMYTLKTARRYLKERRKTTDGKNR